jgi:FemAB-related protein (PEP-CTERM system-associated)
MNTCIDHDWRTVVRTPRGGELADCARRWARLAESRQPSPLSQDLRWLDVLAGAFDHRPYCIEAAAGDGTGGFLPLLLVRSLLFGRFLVGLPYLNSGGVVAGDDSAARALIDRAVELADQLDVRYLELRHEQPIAHPAFNASLTTKVHMRLTLQATVGSLWDELSTKVRNQVRKGQKCGLAVLWGGTELLDEFYDVFSRNMRDLGTPVYGRKLFWNTLATFPGDAELCVVRGDGAAVAAALLLHGRGVTEVPSASCLRSANPTCANMLMYWHLLQRAVERGQAVFDFGRSSRDSGTYRFKEQWGAQPHAAEWQYYVRRGTVGDMRPDNPRFQRRIRIWQRLPVWFTRFVGPAIVRGIP